MVTALPWNREGTKKAQEEFENEFKAAFLRFPSVVVNDSIAMDHTLFRGVIRKQEFQAVSEQRVGGHRSFMVSTRPNKDFNEVLLGWLQKGTKLHGLSDRINDEVYLKAPTYPRARLERLRELAADYVEHVESLDKRIQYTSEKEIPSSGYRDSVLQCMRLTQRSVTQPDVKKLLDLLGKRWERLDAPDHEDLRRDLLDVIRERGLSFGYAWVDMNILLYGWQANLSRTVGNRLVVGREIDSWHEANIPITTKPVAKFSVTVSSRPLLDGLTWEGVAKIREHGRFVRNAETLIQATATGADLEDAVQDYFRELREGFDEAAELGLAPKPVWNRRIPMFILGTALTAGPILAAQLPPVLAAGAGVLSGGISAIGEDVTGFFFDHGLFDRPWFRQTCLSIKQDVFS